MKLTGKVAVVTGASRGIGKANATSLFGGTCHKTIDISVSASPAIYSCIKQLIHH
jgi:NAD(P)-dependent dehydrogenase (short-subunit alcohol dehydrogenase family)